jgi:hypothetical protein
MWAYQQALDVFSFLKDSTSPDYIQATEEAKNALISSQVKTNLHELAERMQMLWLFEKELPYRRILQTFNDIDRRVSELSA